MRIFLGPVDIAGYYTNLAQGFRKIGIEAHCFFLRPHPFQYQGRDSEHFFLNWIDFLDRSMKSENRLTALFASFLYVGTQFCLFIYAAIRFDVFIFGFGRGILPKSLLQAELWFLKRLGKKLIFRFHGSDCRPPYINGFRPDNKDRVCIEKIKRAKQKIKIIERYADFCITAPAQAQFFEKDFIWGGFLGPPQPPRIMDEIKSPENSTRCVKILHSPSRFESKGSSLILQMIEKLKDEGFDIDFTLLQGASNAEVLKRISESDLVIDQCYSDTPMAGLAAEAASLGKATLVGGYISSELEKYFPISHTAPSFFCQPEEMLDKIRAIIRKPACLKQKGREAQSFIKDKWSQETVAAGFMRLLEKNIPSQWYFSPLEIEYGLGAGIDKIQVKANVKHLIETHGLESLQLNDKPRLIQFYQKMITSG
ncbi:MAG: hypothetical protein ACO3LE_06235 [Bdellovibrionota bacterium]